MMEARIVSARMLGPVDRFDLTRARTRLGMVSAVFAILVLLAMLPTAALAQTTDANAVLIKA
ncbi:MAG: hypothetical protein ACREDR_24460, partial [Blastocatellia bacterium]